LFLFILLKISEVFYFELNLQNSNAKILKEF